MFTQKQKLRYTCLLLFAVIVFLQGCSKNDISDMQDRKLFYQVVDNYNTSKYTLTEQEQILKNDLFVASLHEFNEELNSSSEVDFYEMGIQAVEFIGLWNKPKDLANGYGHKDLTDQHVAVQNKEIYITPVDAFVISQKTQTKLGLHYFSKEHFIYEGEIPIVLGYGFKQYYKIGDTIPLMYLRESFDAKVIGFFEDDLQFDEFLHCSSYSTVLIPYMENIEDRDDYQDEYNFIQTYNSFKNSGYLYIKNAEDFDSRKNSLEKLAQKYGLDYTLLRGY